MKQIILYILFFAPLQVYGQIPSDPALSIGDRAPAAKGTDQNGDVINKDQLLKKGPVVLIFYRGNWCPYCRKHLKNLQDSLQLILERGASVIVVTPEKPESIDKMISKTDAEFSILHDKNYKIMNAYGVAYTLSEETVPRYFNSVLKNTREANGNQDDMLPVPATFIIGKENKIRFIHFDPDYRVRLSVHDILEHL